MTHLSRRVLLKMILTCATWLDTRTTATAQVVVAPTALANTEGNAGYGFNNGSGTTFQQIYGTSQLVGLSPGDQITGYRWRLDGGQPAGPNSEITLSNFDVYLGPSNFPVGSLSASFAGNQGAGTILARAGALTIPSFSFPGGSTPNGFGFLIMFSTPYTYTGGSLLLSVSHSGTIGGTLVFDGSVGQGITDVQYRQGAGYSNPILDSNLLDSATIVQFTTIPAPEPSSLFLTISATAGLIRVSKRRQTKIANSNNSAT